MIAPIRRYGALALVLLLINAPPALAQPWRINPDTSLISFTYLEDGAPAKGGFERFSGAGHFDPDRPQKATLDLSIEVGSIRLSDSLRADLVKTDTWFDAKHHPTARFQLKTLTPLKKAGVYRADGLLTIKKRSRRVRPTITLDISGRSARARGLLAFKRSDFRIGDPTLGLFVEIGDKITVAFDLKAER